MKTLKFAIVAVLLACTMVSLANANTDGFGPKPKKVINITFEKAIHNPGLVAAMYQQLDPKVLNHHQLVYTLSVTYEGTLYRITGTYEQWKMFFSKKWNLKKEIKPIINHS